MLDLELVSTIQTAKLLMVSTKTLANSRYSGRLSGRTAPSHITQGRSVFYERSVLDSWASQSRQYSSIPLQKI